MIRIANAPIASSNASSVSSHRILNSTFAIIAAAKKIPHQIGSIQIHASSVPITYDPALHRSPTTSEKSTARPILMCTKHSPMRYPKNAAATSMNLSINAVYSFSRFCFMISFSINISNEERIYILKITLQASNIGNIYRFYPKEVSFSGFSLFTIRAIIMLIKSYI